jgi:3-oxoacyl-[acyl-carrier-protein] synthase II
MKIVISGMGHCSALGQGMEQLRRAIRPEPQQQTIDTRHGAVKVSVLRVPDLQLPKLVPEAVERRMSRFSKMALSCLAEAVEDAQVDLLHQPERFGLVVGTVFGSLEFANAYQRRVLQDGPAGASPTLFAASIHNSMAAQLTLAFGLRGPNSTVSTMEQTAIGSLRLAYDWLNAGVVDRVAVVIGDELSEYHLYYLAHQAGAQPAGEGMQAFILERAELAHKTYAEMDPPLIAEASANDAATPFTGCGSMLNSVAFDVAVAALQVERSGQAVKCLQTVRGLSAQSVSLR